LEGTSVENNRNGYACSRCQRMSELFIPMCYVPKSA
jgi:hypothetical protein